MCFYGPKSDEVKGGFQQALFDALTSYTSRWEHVQFHFIHPVTLSWVRDVPYLRGLSMSTGSTLQVTQFPFASCPRLVSVSWPSVPSVSLPWPQLTHIDLHRVSSEEAFVIIRSSPKLTDLKIGLYNDIPSSLPCGAAVNRSLQKLELHVYHTCGALIKGLTLPTLTDICIEFEHESASIDVFQEELLHFWSRSKCKLVQLELRECDFIDVELLECLEHDSCKTLVDLRIWNTDNIPTFTDDLLLALTEVENNALLPNLAHLWLGMCFGGSPGRLGTMILSRCISRDKKERLQDLHIYIEGGPEEGDTILLQLAENQGLGVDIFTDAEFEMLFDIENG